MWMAAPQKSTMKTMAAESWNPLTRAGATFQTCWGAGGTAW
nr:hypothetical protein [Fretibacterium sp. OH1220_COT-178]